MPSAFDRIFASASPSSSTTTSTPSTSSSSYSTPLPDLELDPPVKSLPGGYTRLASGIVLDPSGKPCKQCTSGSAWMAMMKKSSKSTSSTDAQRQNEESTAGSFSTSSKTSLSSATTPFSNPLPSAHDIRSPSTSSSTQTHNHSSHKNQMEEPPSVETLGTSSWTLLHSLAATYPPTAPPTMQSTMSSFISAFTTLYPCGTCAADFQDWIKESPKNDFRRFMGGRDELGGWLCRAHNGVNDRLGKEQFDCALWKRRWGGEEE